MQLKITWELEEDKSIDLYVPDSQAIKDTIEVLENSGYLSANSHIWIKYIRSQRTRKTLSVLETYKSCNILNGDIVEIVSKEEI